MAPETPPKEAPIPKASSFMLRVLMLTLELYFCSYELVLKILMIPNIVTPVLANVKVSHKTFVIFYQALSNH